MLKKQRVCSVIDPFDDRLSKEAFNLTRNINFRDQLPKSWKSKAIRWMAQRDRQETRPLLLLISGPSSQSLPNTRLLRNQQLNINPSIQPHIKLLALIESLIHDSSQYITKARPTALSSIHQLSSNGHLLCVVSTNCLLKTHNSVQLLKWCERVPSQIKSSC